MFNHRLKKLQQFMKKVDDGMHVLGYTRQHRRDFWRSFARAGEHERIRFVSTLKFKV
jgi:hypothetical protein